MTDAFVGTWTLNPARSKFDANHQPSNGTMTFQRDEDGSYLLTASMLKPDGQTVSERPQRMRPDGQAYPVPDLHGLSTVTTRPNPRTLVGQVRREDGSLVGEGEYVVSPDGQTLTATTKGFDTQLRQFKMQTAWDRV
jgi:hypothetical protein